MMLLENLQKLACFNKSADMIVPGRGSVWVGNRFSAQCVDFMQENKIALVINCTTHLSFPGWYEDLGIQKVRIPLLDSPAEDQQQIMSEHALYAVKLIHECVSNGKNVLVHCHAGIQRSATVVLSYLMWVEYKKGKQVKAQPLMMFMKLKRPGVFEPTPSFAKFIHAWENELAN